MNRLLYIISLTIFFGCKNNKDYIRKTNDDGSYMLGKVVLDSFYDGRVKIFSKKDFLLGYTIFRNGVENGISVRYHPNGIASDSLFFKNGMKSGFAYKFDSLHRPTYKTYFFNDRNLGHTYEYDSTGRIVNYYFIDFEGNAIYQTWLKDSVPYENGSLINASVNQKLIGNEKREILFLYIINPPFIKTHYELAVLNKDKQIISSKRIDSNNCFYEEVLNDLLAEQKHAIVQHTYNPHKGKDDLKISIIE